MEARAYTFIESEFCTPHCGISQFEDWAHTPLCEQREEEAYERMHAEADAAYERLEHILDAERDSGRAPEILTFTPAPPTSPWVRRAQENDLPTFDRHNGAYAYR